MDNTTKREGVCLKRDGVALGSDAMTCLWIEQPIHILIVVRAGAECLDGIEMMFELML